MRPSALRALCLLLPLFPFASVQAATATPSRAQLEQVDGGPVLHWVKAENKKTQNVLASDPRYKPLYDRILSAQQSPDRLAVPTQMAGEIWNFWQDKVHARGVWRSTSEADFKSGHPLWKTRFDLDELSRSEHANWVMEGLNCLEPADRICLLGLSNAGEDAHELREYDTTTNQFVQNGFRLPNGKQAVAWLDKDTVLVSRDWGTTDAGLTTSGYPYVVRALKRGQSLSQAQEVFRGTGQDMEVVPTVLRDGQGHQVVLIDRHKDFFHSEVERLDPVTLKTVQLPMPEKYDGLSYQDGQLVFHLLQDWSTAKGTIPADSVVAVDPDHPQAPEIIVTPTKRQTIGDGMDGAIAATKDGLIVVMYDNVQPVLMLYRRGSNGHWSGRSIELAKNMAASIVSSDPHSSEAYLQLEGFIQPPQIWSVNTARQNTQLLYSQPELFDSSKLTVEQLFAPSKDGTQVPYFVVHAKDWTKNGANPTLMTAYGGFGLSYLPVYHPDLGITWFERGGVYVMANIRGGGEFGPAWHEAARHAGRQSAYDDFASVARDLFSRNITSAKRLGIRGRSNGGLLMGVEFTQHPELWNATIIGVPLLDMLNYEHMAAGASWAAEYGSVSTPEGKAFWDKTSPLQALKPDVHYPTPFIFTSTRDDRVGPVHARLFAARLQEFHVPFFYYEDMEGGHAGTVNAAEVAHERALEAVYLSRRLMDPR
ncbi:S9 family peptidase [Gluconobacter cerinus]|uniref:prolyl oligopeptidase family serine peptidase n=1 Tax=Gluconobacter cerinus TaxID=38307 RepID=UPI001B8B1ECC|nr:prolyl oligopeptidase family serine peptidase [Gluconobacter cerinus]MBS1018762.1 S9 family peptidase [Gluconobacter cerinus]